MKAIIPVAGAGTRMRPFTYTQPKALMPIAGKPIISYIVDDLKRVGVSEFIFIVGYFGDKIVDYIRDNEPDISAEFVFQNNREGLGHALFLAKEHVDLNEEILIALGDSIIEVKDEFFTSKKSSIVIKKVKDPRFFGIAEFNEQGVLSKLVEKPKFPKSNEALVGWYKIKETEKLFAILDKYNREDIRTNGEIQFTDVLNEMLNDGIPFETFVADQWLDVGNGEILIQSNAIMLKKHGGKISDKATVENCAIIEPVFIADHCIVKNSIIGPNVTIGSNSVVKNSLLMNGIIGNFTQINKLKLEDFMIGSDSKLKGSTQSLTVGDNTELDFSR